MASSDSESEAVASFDPVEWADSERDALLEQYSPSEPEADPDGVLVSVALHQTGRK